MFNLRQTTKEEGVKIFKITAVGWWFVWFQESICMLFGLGQVRSRVLLQLQLKSGTWAIH